MSPYHECPIAVAEIEKLNASISHLKNQSHLTADETKLLYRLTTDLICRVIKDYQSASPALDCLYLDMVGFPTRRCDPPYTPEPWEVSLAQWVQNQHCRTRKLAELLSSMEIRQVLRPFIRQISLPDFSFPLIRYDLHEPKINPLIQDPCPQVRYFSDSFNQMRDTLEIIIPIVRVIRYEKRLLTWQTADSSPPPMGHGFEHLKEVCARYTRVAMRLERADILDGTETMYGIALLIPDETVKKARELAESFTHEETALRANFILEHGELPASRSSTTSLDAEIETLSGFVDRSIIDMQGLTSELNIYSGDAGLEEQLWHLEDVVTLLREREEMQKTINRMLKEESARSIEIAVAAMPTRPIDASMLDDLGHAECYICRDRVNLGEVVTVPVGCSHWSHADCIHGWATNCTALKNHSAPDGVVSRFKAMANCFCGRDVFTGERGN